MVDTAPLPPVGPADGDPGVGDAPTERRTPAGRGSGQPDGAAEPPGRPVGPALRALEVVAGLASGGLLVVGLVLVVLQLLAPRIAPGTGLAAPSGPGWTRAGAQLGVGLAGELVVLARRWGPRPVRAVLACLVIAASGAVLWFAWWA